MIRIEIIITKENGDNAYYFKFHANAQFDNTDEKVEYETSPFNKKFSGLKEDFIAGAGKVAQAVLEKLLEKEGYQAVIKKF